MKIGNQWATISMLAGLTKLSKFLQSNESGIDRQDTNKEKILMLELMTHKDYELLVSGEFKGYYLGRWEYFKKVIEIIEQLSVEKVLEIGPGHLPIVKNADILLNPQDDHFGKPDHMDGQVIMHDVTVKPWPLKDKQYDLVVALQVWEHLDNKQTRAFREVMRVSKRAILSFPYQWDGGSEKYMHRLHRDIDIELIQDWTLNIKPAEKIEIPRTGPEFSKGKRMICYWEFE
jgi:hypothetical protein